MKSGESNFPALGDLSHYQKEFAIKQHTTSLYSHGAQDKCENLILSPNRTGNKNNAWGLTLSTTITHMKSPHCQELNFFGEQTINSCLKRDR